MREWGRCWDCQSTNRAASMKHQLGQAIHSHIQCHAERITYHLFLLPECNTEQRTSHNCGAPTPIKIKQLFWRHHWATLLFFARMFKNVTFCFCHSVWHGKQPPTCFISKIWQDCRARHLANYSKFSESEEGKRKGRKESQKPVLSF